MKKLFWLTALCMLLTQVSTAQIYDIYSVIPTFNTVETDNYCSDSPIAVEVVMTAGAITDDDGFSIRMKSYPGGLSWAGYDGLCPDDYNCAYGFSIDPGDVPDGLYYFEASCKFFAHAGDPDYEQSEVFSLKTITCGNVEDPLNWTSAKVRDNTGMSMADGKIYYVDDNRKVRNFYWTGTNWISDVLNTTAPKAKDGVDIVATVENVYYVGDDNKIKNLYWTGTDWAYTSLVASQPEVRSNSNIAFGDGKIYFVSADNNKVYNLYKVGATWYCSALNNDAPDVRDDSKLATDVGKVYFVSSTPLNASTNKMIYNYYWDGDSWEYAMLNSSAPKAMDGAGPAVCNAKVYYTAEDQKVKRLKWNTATGVWDVNSLLATQKLVDAGEQIAVVDDIIFFHNSFDLVYYLKVSGHAW
ncbi:MAG TPA: hypothetical protein PKE14_11535, partial [Chitinophagales bacterium]|nr:hypothetical protein [Chitinophagales bacterium]